MLVSWFSWHVFELRSRWEILKVQTCRTAQYYPRAKFFVFELANFKSSVNRFSRSRQCNSRRRHDNAFILTFNVSW